jgi:hypothetical protein
MRRALLLGIALLAPALGARAQSITFTPNVIGVSGCGSSSTKTITLAVTPMLVTGASLAAGGVFRVVATKSATTTSNGLTICASDAGTVGSDVTVTGLTPQSFSVNTAAILSAASVDCASTSDVTVNVCALFLQNGTSASVTNPSGSATGTVTFSVAKPGVPTNVSVQPAEAGLVVSWSGSANASYYIVTAIAVNAADDPATHTTTQLTSTSKQMISGLKNGVTYDVTVTAYSAADTPSDPSAAVQGTPIPVDDFWSRYHNAGGPEQGGCASGPADLLGMLLAAAALSRIRRRS